MAAGRPFAVVVVVLMLAACGGRTENGESKDGSASGGRNADGSGGGVPTDGVAPTDGGAPIDGEGANSTAISDGGFTADARESGSVDSGATCNPLPGCTSTTTCPATDGCNTCRCQGGGVWQCTGYTCPGEAGAHNQDCPPLGPEEIEGTACGASIVCNYVTACLLRSCKCAAGFWACQLVTQNCSNSDAASNACPTAEPAHGADCSLSGTACEYATCPGGVTTYFDTNCLCVQGRWDCATLPGCDAGSGG